MVNRRIARGSRNKQKKKIKSSKKAHISENPSQHGERPKGLDRVAHLGDDRSTGRVHLIASGRRPLRLKKSRSAASSGALSKLKGKKSLVLKKQAAERMVLKEHLRELEARRAATRRGENAKIERRELGKYIRALKTEQRVKHISELQNVEAELMRFIESRKQKQKDCLEEEDNNGNPSHSQDWEDLDDGEASIDSMGEKELQELFSHLTT
ncbi:unnamed protein product [Phytomonas sp. Hart1]|nr:unnamed protein product [Phytomonas sp. Hart1]|eukprot:CCW69142.1 unnamed protein product [Phytomonas sp. isolate Hart1]